MNDRQESKLNMYQTVLDTCQQNETVYVGIPAFKGGVNGLRENVAVIRQVAQQQAGTVSQGVTIMFYLKQIVVFLILLCLEVQTLYAQSITGGEFTKKIEFNCLVPGWGDNAPCYNNITSKTDIEKLLFGVFNAKLEFFVAPSFEGSYGFRIVRDSLDTSYLLELKRINNFDEVNSQLSKEYPLIGFSAEEMSSISVEKSEQARLHNNAMCEKQEKESLKRYKVDTKHVFVKDDFAEKLYVKVVDAINNFKGKGIPPMINDGYKATFRCVVEDELWTLTIHMPKGYMGKLTDIFNQLIKDAEVNSLDELKYISLLDNIEVK